jgi:hypothetical protein
MEHQFVSDQVEPELQKCAHFVTQLSAQNVETVADDSAYTYLISVHRPMLFIQYTALVIEP